MIFVFECEAVKFKGSYLSNYLVLENYRSHLDINSLNCVGYSFSTLAATILSHVTIVIQTILLASRLLDAVVHVQIYQSIHDISIVVSRRTCSFDPFQLLVTTLTFHLV